MYFVFSASRLMKASEVREVCGNLRNNPELLHELEKEKKAKVYEKMASAPTLAIAQ